jgi:hypothetical protein
MSCASSACRLAAGPDSVRCCSATARAAHQRHTTERSAALLVAAWHACAALPLVLTAQVAPPCWDADSAVSS